MTVILCYYSSQPLEIGMVLTNEPGLYGTFEMEIDDEFYTETCGIRIEDQLLITKKVPKLMSIVLSRLRHLRTC